MYDNPVVLGISVAAATYLYLRWRNDQNKKNKTKKNNIFLPLIVGTIVWFIASCYLEKPTPRSIEEIKNTTYKLVQSEKSPMSQTYRLIGKNRVRLPPTDVFLDIAQF